MPGDAAREAVAAPGSGTARAGGEPPAAAGGLPAGTAGAAVPWGLYVHVPFCPYRCAYCDFVAVAGGERVARWRVPYLQALEREARELAATLCPGPPVSVFYGGGTPTLLPADALARLHASLSAAVGVPSSAEVTVEANPDTVDARALRTLRAAGVNRLSLGLQASQRTLLAALGRGHTWRGFLAAFEAARSAGFANVNVDVMYGLPGQSTAQVAETLARVAALRPEHVSAYALQVEPGTPFFASWRRGQLALPAEEQVAEAFALCRALLGAEGYDHYEISNFALPGRRCRHNLLYWRHEDYLGLGVGAHSHWRGRRWANTRRLAVYCAEAGSGRRGQVAEEEPPDPRRERSEGAFLGLRLLIDGLGEDEFARRYGLALRAAFPGVVERLLARGLLEELPGGRVRLAPSAVPLANRVFVEFV